VPVDGEDVGGQDGIGHGLVLVGWEVWSGLSCPIFRSTDGGWLMMVDDDVDYDGD
jgi:hypothetical protein